MVRTRSHQDSDVLHQSSAADEAEGVDESPNIVESSEVVTSSTSVAGTSIPATSSTSEGNEPIPPQNLAILPTGLENHEQFVYRHRTHAPIARWPGSYAGERTIHAEASQNALLREWLAEQRRTIHGGRFESENDDLLALSSDEEVELLGMPNSMRLREVYDDASCTTSQGARGVYIAQCMVGVIERFHRHGRRKAVRYALQLTRTLREYDGSGPSRAVLRDLQAAERTYDLHPVVETAAERLMETVSHVVSRHDPNTETIQLLEQLRTAIMQTQPFNGVMTSPELTYFRPTRYRSNPRPFSEREELYAEAMGRRLHDPYPSHLGWATPVDTPRVASPPTARIPQSSPALGSVDGVTSSSPSAMSLAALREAPQPITAILPSQVPAPVRELTARELRRFLAEAELYEQRSGARLSRHLIGNERIRGGIALLWQEHFQAQLGKTWDDESMSWKHLIHNLLSRLGLGSTVANFSDSDKLAQIHHAWSQTWEFNPANVGNLYSVESDLNIIIAEAQLTEEYLTQITPDIIRLIITRARFSAINRLWGLNESSMLKAETLRRRFFPQYTKTLTLSQWWAAVRRNVQAWSDNLRNWGSALGIPEAEMSRMYAAEGAMIRAVHPRGSSSTTGQQPGTARTRPAPAPAPNKPQKKARTQENDPSVPPGEISSLQCRFCIKAGVKRAFTHLRRSCPYYHKDKADPMDTGMNIVLHNMCSTPLSLPIINIFLQNQTATRVAGKALLDSGANANFIHPKTLGACDKLYFQKRSTNTRLALALNAASTADDAERTYEDVDRKINLNNFKFRPNKNSYYDYNTVRLLINHLMTDDINKGQDNMEHPIVLDTMVTIHLSVESTGKLPIYITCDAYVANIRYPVILGYPTLRQYDLFRRLPHLWSSNHQSDTSVPHCPSEDAERRSHQGNTDVSECEPANNGVWDSKQFSTAQSALEKKAEGESTIAWEARIVDDQTHAQLHHVEIDETIDTRSFLCAMCTTEETYLQHANEKVAAQVECCHAAFDDEPEQLFVAHLYQKDSTQCIVDASLNNMMIGTLESSGKRHNFTSRSPKDWEDIEDIDDDRLDTIPAEMLEVAATDHHVADRVSFQGPPSLKEELHNLVAAYADIFSSSVNQYQRISNLSK